MDENAGMRKAWGARPAVTAAGDRIVAVVPARQVRRSPLPPERGRLAVVEPRRPASPVGRDSVVSLARAHLAEGSSVLVVGPPGIGKSTVLATLTDALSGARVLRAAAAEVESGLPYLNLVDLIWSALTETGSMLPRYLRPS